MTWKLEKDDSKLYHCPSCKKKFDYINWSKINIEKTSNLGDIVPDENALPVSATCEKCKKQYRWVS